MAKRSLGKIMFLITLCSVSYKQYLSIGEFGLNQETGVLAIVLTVLAYTLFKHFMSLLKLAIFTGLSLILMEKKFQGLRLKSDFNYNDLVPVLISLALVYLAYKVCSYLIKRYLENKRFEKYKEINSLDNVFSSEKPTITLKKKNPKMYHKKMGSFVNKKGKFFEDYVATLYRKLGKRAYSSDELKAKGNMPKSVLAIGGSGEQGVDVVVFEKDHIKLIQCKHYDKNVGNSSVQEIYTSVNMYEKHFGKKCIPAIISNKEFTRSAKALAESTGVELIGREKLNTLINKAA